MAASCAALPASVSARGSSGVLSLVRRVGGTLPLSRLAADLARRAGAVGSGPTRGEVMPFRRQPAETATRLFDHLRSTDGQTRTPRWG
jgi:hypothetical protein